jgi:hypothetical protein
MSSKRKQTIKIVGIITPVVTSMMGLGIGLITARFNRLDARFDSQQKQIADMMKIMIELGKTKALQDIYTI